ncbi:hypothetical protein [Streptomyces albireticuli]|uniref:hypothetical protein n=1 Tax=Streptomyces albireticuli TaxID=1940 RepID=UPI0036BBF191
MTADADGYRIGATVVYTRGGVVGVTRQRDRGRYLIKGAASGFAVVGRTGRSPHRDRGGAAGDAPQLFKETIRTMAIKSAVYDLMDGDEKAAELPVSVPVDTMSHALMAQFTLLCRMQQRGGFQFVHMTDMEEGVGGGTWDYGDYTHQCYRQAFGPVNERFWIGREETERRRKVLDKVYAGIGITERGKRVAIQFGVAAQPWDPPPPAPTGPGAARSGRAQGPPCGGERKPVFRPARSGTRPPG